MRTSALLVLLFILCLAGCAIDPVRNYADRPITAENRGYVLLSMGPANFHPDLIHYNVLLRERPAGKAISVLYTTGNLVVTATPPDFTSGTARGAVYLLELPAGDYEVYRFRVFGPQAFSPVLSIPFIVRPGQTTYIGRFMVGWVAGHGPRGVHLDAFDEDVKIARKKFPEETALQTLNRSEVRGR